MTDSLVESLRAMRSDAALKASNGLLERAFPTDISTTADRAPRAALTTALAALSVLGATAAPGAGDEQISRKLTDAVRSCADAITSWTPQHPEKGS